MCLYCGGVVVVVVNFVPKDASSFKTKQKASLQVLLNVSAFLQISKKKVLQK